MEQVAHLHTSHVLHFDLIFFLFVVTATPFCQFPFPLHSFKPYQALSVSHNQNCGAQFMNLLVMFWGVHFE